MQQNLLKRWARLRDWLLGAVLATAITLLLCGVRAQGSLQNLDLYGHDVLLHWVRSALPPQQALPITMVWLTDEDEALLGTLVPDSVLAEVLRKLQTAGAAAIGLDLYRDIPVPDREGRSGQQALTAALRDNAALYGVFKFGGPPPPPALTDTGRTGFADFVYDDGGFLRRGLLFLNDEKTAAVSLAYQLATHLLRAEGIVPVPGQQVPEHLRLGQAEFPPLDMPAGPYQRFDARGYQFLLTFPHPSVAVREISFGQLVKEGLAPGALNGQLVLVGNRTETAKDYFFTPYSRWVDGDQRVFGALAHALAVRQLVAMARGQLAVPWYWSFAQETAWLLAWCVIGVLMGALARLPWQLGALVLGCVVVQIGAAGVAQRAGLLMPWIPTLMGWFLALCLAALENLRRARLARTQWAALFASRTSPALAEHCWQHREDLLEHGRMRPQTLYATVLFTDLRGFSTVSENMPVDDLMDWLNAYMEAMVSEVYRHNGFVDKLIGDAVMAVFGVPMAAKDAATRATNAQAAVHCAQAMAVRLQQFNAEWEVHGFQPATMRIGIASGSVVAGTLGGRNHHQEYTVLGDTVNTASRLESHDKSFAQDDPCRILINAATAQWLEGTPTTLEPVGELALHGKATSVQVFRVQHQAKRSEP